jgi:uncharacterized membrane protein
MTQFVTGLLLVLAGWWLYRKGVQYDRRHGSKRK